MAATMSMMVLTPGQIELLASCAEIGLEGAAQNPENTDPELVAIETVIAELREVASHGADIHLTVECLGTDDTDDRTELRAKINEGFSQTLADLAD